MSIKTAVGVGYTLAIATSLTYGYWKCKREIKKAEKERKNQEKDKEAIDVVYVIIE